VSGVQIAFAVGGALLTGLVGGFFFHDHLRRAVEAMVDWVEAG